ncbi:MAG TPA: hypothetical protein VE172_11935 [Stackebrandtia sp.]|nr:hypothetical protein [Stackebrandtia sp.]HZE39509.1 hypothetical protein [Stackebrandtia sp.]
MEFGDGGGARADQAGGHRVDGDAVGDQFHGQRAGQARDSRLGGGVGGLGGDPVDDARGGGDVDDPSPAALGHALDEGAAHQERGGQVALHLVLPLGVGELGDGAQHGGPRLGGETGVVDQDVDLADLFGDRVGQARHLGVLGEVDDEARAADLGGALVDAFGGRHDDDLGARGAQPLGDGEPDALGAARPRHQGHLPLQAIHIGLLGADGRWVNDDIRAVV